MNLDFFFRNKESRMHFIGIGGIGMSGIAKILLELKCRIWGSDWINNVNVTELKKLGANVFEKHMAENLEKSKIVVFSNAIKSNNVEFVEAKKRKLITLRRAEMLSCLINSKFGIAIAGAHGKTTVSSLISTIFTKAASDASFVVGGNLKQFKNSAKLGQGKFFITEADESDGSFLRLLSNISIITNVDAEHIDYFGNIERIMNGFLEFSNNTRPIGAVVACCDDPYLKNNLFKIKRRVVTYGLSEESFFSAKNIKHEGPYLTFTVLAKKKALGDIRVLLSGTHNVQNALGAITACIESGIGFNVIKNALCGFCGTERRFSLANKDSGNVLVIDDYAHHPSEIAALVDATKAAFPNRRVFIFFQPHRYSRTSNLLDKFVASLSMADYVFITDIYSAGETPVNNISSKILVNKMKKNGFLNAFYTGSLGSSNAEIIKHIKPGDILLVAGAGDINKNIANLLHLTKEL